MAQFANKLKVKVSIKQLRINQHYTHWILGPAFLIAVLSCLYWANHMPKFSRFIGQMRIQAKQQGVSQQTIERYLPTNLQPHQRLLHRLANHSHHFAKHKHHPKPLLSAKRIETTKHYCLKHRYLLRKISKHYQVPAAVIVALWGLESSFGNDMGKEPMVQSLATLAYLHHRQFFYQNELVAALKVLDQKPKLLQKTRSTFDGGMGQAQFEPSTYLTYAVDYDQDGFADIWNSHSDIFASIANYLHQAGWQMQKSWGQKVTLQYPLADYITGIDHQMRVKTWRHLGVHAIKGQHLPPNRTKASLIQPNGEEGPTFLVYDNFYALLKWNRSSREGLKVGLLADRLRYFG